MRHILPAATLIAGLLAATLAAAFEIEEERFFAAPTPRTEMHILSTADLDLFAPLIEAFQLTRPEVSIRYTVVSSAALFSALRDEGAAADLAISSAMDLQMKLANDGLTQAHRSPLTDALPDWARWRNQIFAFTQEPAVVIASEAGFEGLSLPGTRAELITLLRNHPERFRGRIGTYDIRSSGLGYLFATQDARQSDAYWRLTQEMGGLGPRLYCCSSDMIADLRSGRIIVAYNVLGSYAAANFRDGQGNIVVPMTDYTNIMLRTAVIPARATQPALGAAFIDFLISPAGRDLVRSKTGLPPIDGAALSETQYLRPIRLGPGLLVYLDRLKRAAFLREWGAALAQP